MLHILWMIIKILLFVILCILGILLVVTALVLFVPVRYRVHAEKEAEMEASVKLTWLLHMITLRAGWRGKSYLTVKAFGIPLYDKDRKKKKPVKAAVKREIADDVKKEQNAAPEKKSADPEAEKETEITKETEMEDDTDTQKPLSFFQKIMAFFRMLLERIKNIRYTIQGFCDKIKGVAQQAAYYKDVLEREETKRAFLQCRRQLFRIWKNIRPKKLSVRLHFGAADPAVTGQALALHGMFYPWIYPYVTIEPEFEREVAEGCLDCKGRVTAVVLLFAAAKLYFDKDIRYFIELFKKEDLTDGR